MRISGICIFQMNCSIYEEILEIVEMLIWDSVLALNQLSDSIDRVGPSAITKTNTLKQSIVTAVRFKDILGVCGHQKGTEGQWDKLDCLGREEYSYSLLIPSSIIHWKHLISKLLYIVRACTCNWNIHKFI